MSRYPAELTERVEVAGEILTIRPIREEDAELLQTYFGSLTPEEVRLRFFAAIRELSEAQLIRFTRLDYDRDMALIAVREATGEIVGVARLVHEDWPSAEFAVIVRRELRGRGLATHLMRRLIEWAKLHGIRELHGEILAENTTMLDFIRTLGFRLRHMPADPAIMQAHLALEPSPVG